MKLPNSKVYWADFLSYSAILSDKEICQVLKIIAIRAMSYDNPQDNLQDNPQDLKQKQIQIQKLNKIQLDFYTCLAKAQDESAKDYIASVMNGRKGGRPKKKEKQELNENQKNQYSNKKSGQLDRQDGGQDVDKDIDIDKDNNKEIYNIYFEEFWNLYTPIKCDGRFVAKGDKKASLAKFIKILQKGEDYENIIRGTKQYIDYCRENNQLTCGVPVFLNQERWKNDYSGSTCQSSERGKRQGPRSIVETYAEIAAEYEKKNNIW